MRLQGERGYPMFPLNITSSWIASLLTTILIVGLSVAFYVVYSHFSPDNAAGDSVSGYTFAFLGTGFMMAAAVGFSKYRRSRHRTVGKLNGILNWHVAFGTIALILLFFHCAGNFNPRTGTYALYSMIALAICGFIGRAIDRIAPRMMTGEVSKALTVQGEDRIESISQRLSAIVSHNTVEEVRGFRSEANAHSMPGIPGLTSSPFANTASRNAKNLVGKNGSVLQSSWDLAYISMEETPQELSRDSAQYRFVPDRRSVLARPGALIPGAQEHISALTDVQKALKREVFFRYIIRYWRMFHVSLAILTIALTLWHLEYAVGLLLPVFFHV